MLLRSHDQRGHPGIDKVQQRKLHRFDWPGLRKACERYVNTCLSCLQVKDTRKIKFPLKSVESLALNEVVQIKLSEDLHDRLGIQSNTRNHRTLYETVRIATMSDGLSGRDLSSFDSSLDITIWLSDDFPIGQ